MDRLEERRPAVIRYVVDASSVGPLLLRDEAANAVAEVARALSRGECIVPAHWRFEVANMLLIAERTGRVDAETVLADLSDFDKFSVEIDFASLGSAWDRTYELARRHRLTIYDAAYLELSRRLGLILVTLDGPLAGACRTEGIEVIGK
jgi:predicted nucleic acid-binding protein